MSTLAAFLLKEPQCNNVLRASFLVPTHSDPSPFLTPRPDHDASVASGTLNLKSMSSTCNWLVHKLWKGPKP